MNLDPNKLVSFVLSDVTKKDLSLVSYSSSLVGHNSSFINIT